MAKYYVQSGTFQMLVTADAADKAALWAVHCAMQQVVPVCENQQRTPEQKRASMLETGGLVLGAQIRLSERGYNRADAKSLDTCDVVVEWSQLMVALAKIERLARRDEPGTDARFPIAK